MNRFAHVVKSVARRDDAQDLLEYALLVALIASWLWVPSPTPGTTQTKSLS